jgi:hypothetical protein
MIGTEYIIVGDTDKYKDCLIYTCGKSLEHARNVLDQMLNNPDENDLKSMEGHYNIRIKEVQSKDGWWNDPFLAN